MKISYIGTLQNSVTHTCSICSKVKLLEYVMMDNQDNVLSVCKECRDRVEEPGD